MSLDAPDSRRPQLEDLVAAGLLALATVWIFRGALDLYFAQDDFGGLARATGVLPRHDALWRYVSVQSFMDVFHPLFRDHPWPYHFVSLALHAGNGVLLFALLARRFSKAAALVGAACFATHPALFTTLYWISARADIMAATFALCTMALALRAGRERWLALPAFALSLLSKESTLPLPAVIGLLLWLNVGQREPAVAGTRAARKLDLLLVALALLSAGYVAYLSLPRQVGITISFEKDAAYAFDFGIGSLRNLLTYAGWAADVAMLRPGLRFVDRENPELFPFAIGVLVVAGFLCLWPALRRRGWPVALASFLLLLAPVLPLRNHAYHYYLYAPLMAAGLCVAILVEALGLVTAARPRAVPGKHRTKQRGSVGSPMRSTRVRWVVAATCCLVFTWNGARLVRQMENRPSPVYPGLRGDPIVDRALIAERAISGLRQAGIPPGAHLVFLMRERVALVGRIVRGSGEEAPPQQEVYPESNVKAALFDGIGVRALIPAVDSVLFASRPGPATSRSRYAVYAPTGEVEVFDAASLDSLLRSPWVTRW